MKKGIHFSWLALMAWRDSRRNRSRLLLFVSSIVLGIAALVAIHSLGDNMRMEIDRQAASLLGADLEVSGNQSASPGLQPLFDSLGADQSEELRFASMVYFPKNGGTRLVQIRALQGNFPYYGNLETEPTLAENSFRNKQQALVDQTLLFQYKAKVGDSIKVGNLTFAIAGSLLSAPGQTGLSASVAPAVYIPLRYLEATGLQQKGSRINYRYYFKFNRPLNIDKLVKEMEPRLNSEGFSYGTVETQKENTGRSFKDLTRFLSLVGFIALLLGCMGVASAIHIYVREKINTIAVLRCLGAKASEAFLIYLVQIVGIGFLGSVLGAIMGTIIQQFLPFVIKDFLPFKIATNISWSAIGQGIVLGIIISILFALLPLVSIRNISPLNTLRVSFQEKKAFKDPVKWLVYAGVLLFIFGFTYLQFQSWQQTVSFTVAILFAFLTLTAMAALLMWFIRRFFPNALSYLWRQGLSNLYRPNNQTVILVVSIGLGTAFICTLFLIQSVLLNRITLSASGNQPNFVLFDIQSNQKNEVIKLARKEGLPILQTVPIVTMRLERINNLTPEKLQTDSTLKMPRWVFNREYRVTFRNSLTTSEKLVKGSLQKKSNWPEGTVLVSVEQGFARRAHLNLGDTMVFNVQGAVIPTVVGSFRQVDWNRIRTNFLVVFPNGVLEQAPQFHVLLTHVPSNDVSASFQQKVVRLFPNVSVIDLGLVLSVLDEILGKIGFVIHFMAAFSILTGLVVLIASVLISKYQRIQESVLLRTLGASRRQILVITALEYFFLGGLAAFTGILLSLAAGWALAHYLFDTEFSVQPIPLLIVFVSVCCLTVIIGLMNSRTVLTKPPLEILRQEV